MGDYYNVNKVAQANGDHEVHTAACSYRPAVANRIELGYFYSCTGAVDEAKKYFRESNGCYFCSRPCHTT